MTHDDDFIGQLEGYLDDYEGVTPLPEAVRHAVRLELPTAQRNGRRPAFMRMITMFAPLRFSAAVLGIAIIAFIGIKLLPSSGFIGGPSGSTGASPFALSNATPSATPGSDPQATGPEVRPLRSDYVFGRHSVTVDGIGFSFEISSAGWEPRSGLPGNPLSPLGGLSINKSDAGVGDGQQADGIIYWVPFEGDMVAQPCGYLASMPNLAEINDIAAAIAAAPGTRLVAGPSPVVVDAHTTLKVVVSVQALLGCDPGYFYTFDNSVPDGAFWLESRVADTIGVWVIQVGERRLLLISETRPGAGATLPSQIQQVVDSIEFD